MSKRILLQTSGYANFGGDPIKDDLDCAILEITPQLLDLVRKRAELLISAAAQDDQVYELHFWAPGSIHFYSHNLISHCAESDESVKDDTFDKAFYDQGFAPLPIDDVTLRAFDPERTDVERMVLTLSAYSTSGQLVTLSFCACSKYGSAQVETHRLSIADIEVLLSPAAA